MATVLGALLLLAALRGSDESADRTPRFVDETTSSGLDHRYDGEFEFFVGGGVAAFDCDDDGRDELFLAGGSEPAALFHNDSPSAARCGSRRSRRPSPTCRP